MRKIIFFVLAAVVSDAVLLSCERLDDDIDRHDKGDAPYIPLEDVAAILSEIPLGTEQLREVSDAVSASSGNGYDEEYTMQDLFRSPGAGVGDDRLPGRGRKTGRTYSMPIRELIREHLLKEGSPLTRHDGSVCRSSGDSLSAEDFLKALESSDIQIYWPFSENWDGESYPIVTFDPGDGSDANVGYRVSWTDTGERSVEEVVVDEKMAAECPVWVVNRNDDAGHLSIEMLRKQDPDWGTGGSIIVNPHRKRLMPGTGAPEGRSSVKTLILKDFTMLRNYDTWFAGASEFFVKIGSVEDFTASTEAELQLYSPAVTDFMISVKRKYVGEPRPFNAVLVSDWTDQLDQCAFMITEDDGGTRTSWKCTAVVKIASKSYGFEINLPFNTRDDIVWRGRLSRRYIEATDNMTGHFGDVDLTFEIKDYPQQ